jgi:hypothetical protein
MSWGLFLAWSGRAGFFAQGLPQMVSSVVFRREVALSPSARASRTVPHEISAVAGRAGNLRLRKQFTLCNYAIQAAPILQRARRRQEVLRALSSIARPQ